MKAKIIVTLYIKNVTGAHYTVNYKYHSWMFVGIMHIEKLLNEFVGVCQGITVILWEDGFEAY